MAGFTKIAEHDAEPEQVIQYPGAGPTQQAQPQKPAGPGLAAQMMTIALGALSQRALVALSSLFTAAALLSVWWLFDLCLPGPSPLQLIGLSIYGLFVLLLEFVRRR